MNSTTNHSDVFAEAMLDLFLMAFASITPIIIGRVVMDSPSISTLLSMSFVGAIAGIILCLMVRYEFALAHKEELEEAKRLRAREIQLWCEEVHHKNPYGWVANHQIRTARRKEWDEELASYYS